MIGFRVHFRHSFSDLIGAAQIPAAPNFFYTVSPDPFFEGRAPQDYYNPTSQNSVI